MKKFGIALLTCILIGSMFIVLYYSRENVAIAKVTDNGNDISTQQLNEVQETNETNKTQNSVNKVTTEKIQNTDKKDDKKSSDNSNNSNNNKTQSTKTETPKKENTISSDTKQNTETKKVNNKYSTFTYGRSENNRKLTCYSIEPENYDKTILMVFAIHGYEDSYAKDGKVLVNTAEYLIEKYKTTDIKNTRLLIVKCANPDGLYDGHTNNGFGRCNANGVDLNRDFDIIHKVYTNSRNKTLEPFSAAESRALRDLVLQESPDIVIDFHGWLNCTIGDKELADVFYSEMGISHQTKFNSNCNGYFSYWAHSKGAKALLVEFKNTNISKTKLVNAINEFID